MLGLCALSRDRRRVSTVEIHVLGLHWLYHTPKGESARRVTTEEVLRVADGGVAPGPSSLERPMKKLKRHIDQAQFIHYLAPDFQIMKLKTKIYHQQRQYIRQSGKDENGLNIL